MTDSTQTETDTSPYDVVVGQAEETPPGSDRPKRTSTRRAVEWVVILGAALLAALLIKTFLLQAFYIPSASMEHSLEIGDRVLVNKLSYRLHDVNRGDVVVFKRPPQQGPGPEIKDLIKRVVALEGETVEGHDDRVYVNGKPLRETYLSQGMKTQPFPSQKVPAGHVWVMGDNRPNSNDSRQFGPIRESLIVGRAFVRVWPLTALKLL